MIKGRNIENSEGKVSKREKAKIPARSKDCNAGREITWDAETDSECKVGSDRWWKG